MAPYPVSLSNFLSKLHNYYGKDSPPPLPPPPAISQQTAFLCEALFTILFVAPFYLSSTLRHSPLNSRNAPSVIRARTRAVGLVCVVCTVITVSILTIQAHTTPNEVLRLLGLYPINLIDIAKVLALVIILFSCSLYELIVVDADYRHWSPGAFKAAIWDTWTGYRNLLVAPLGEEIVFRALTIPLFLVAKTSPVRIVFLTPLVFGGAHLHHLVEFLQSRTPAGHRWPQAGVWINGLAVSLFQFVYTSLFGFFAAFVFLRTGNVWAVIAAHSFCNKMGVPRLWGRVGRFEDLHLETKSFGNGVKQKVHQIQVGNSLMQDQHGQGAVRNMGVVWTVVYYALIPVGVVGFYQLIWPLTASSNALATF